MPDNIERRGPKVPAPAAIRPDPEARQIATMELSNEHVSVLRKAFLVLAAPATRIVFKYDRQFPQGGVRDVGTVTWEYNLSPEERSRCVRIISRLPESPEVIALDQDERDLLGKSLTGIIATEQEHPGHVSVFFKHFDIPAWQALVDLLTDSTDR